jgi:mono/diheme cytochrome c family protein
MNADAIKSCCAETEVEVTSTSTTVPIWLFVVLLVLLFLAVWFFDARGGWFEPKVYGPYVSVADVGRFQPKGGADDEILLKGMVQFRANCAVCHMENGVGNPANGCPPLVGSEWVITPSPGRLVRFASKGLTGPISVKGQVYNTGTMLAIGDQLPGDEKEKAEVLAAIISYVRKTFGNIAVTVKPEQVQTIRTEIKDRKAAFTADELKSVPE